MIIDIAFIILIIIAAFKGMRVGIIIAIFSIFAFIIGLAAALKLSAVVAVRLSDQLNSSYKWLPVLSFIIVFFVIAFLINLAGKLIQRSIETIMLGWVNRIGGMLLYIALYTFIFSIFIFYAVQLKFISEATIESSFFYPYIQPLGPKVIEALGTILPVFKDMFEQLKSFFGGLSNKMQH